MVSGMLTVPSGTEQPLSVTDPGATAMRDQFWRQQDLLHLPQPRKGLFPSFLSLQ